MMMRESRVTQLLFMIFLYISPQAGVLVGVGAYLKSSDGRAPSKENVDQFKDQSSNEVLVDEMKQKLAAQHHYYLPMQTTFGSLLNPTSYEGAITSPPHLTISPSSAQKSYEQSSLDIIEEKPYLNDDHITAYLSPCITETPSNDKQPKSELLLPSEELMSKSVVLSGHIEIASKTSGQLAAPEISNTAAEQSFVQGTQIHMSSITDV